MRLLKLALFFVTICNCYTKKQYNNYTLYNAIADTEEKMIFFDKIDDSLDVNYWRRPGLVNMSVQFTVAPENKKDLLALANAYHVPLTVQIDDVQRLFDEQVVKEYKRTFWWSFDWKSYFGLTDIYNWLNDLCFEYPKRIKTYSIGFSFEKRKIMAAIINLGRSKRSPRIIIEGGTHAREWLGVSFVTYLMNQIVTAPSSTNTILKSLAFKFEWCFIPVLNPDGYEYSHRVDRMFRTNKRHVDLNRNFGYTFGTVGVSHKNNSAIYCGPHAFSEPETKALKKFVKSKRKNLKYYISFHTYGQYIIIPYGNTDKELDNYAEVKKIGDLVAKEIQKKYGTKFTVGSAKKTVGYVASGNSADWVKKTFNVRYAMTFELRDKGKYGFALPPNKILPACKETMTGIVSLLWNGNKRNKLQMEEKNGCYINSLAIINFYYVFFVMTIY